MPALEYGVGLWGAGGYTSIAWSKVEVFWKMAARTILKVPLRTPSEAILGDLGWHKFWVRGAWQAVSLWTRVTDAGGGRWCVKQCVCNGICWQVGKNVG